MTIESARILIQKAFEEADTISDFKLRVYNVLNQVYDLPPKIKPGYSIDNEGNIKQ